MKSKIEEILMPYLKHKSSCKCMFYGYEDTSGCDCGLEQALSALSLAQPQRAVGLTVTREEIISWYTRFFDLELCDFDGECEQCKSPGGKTYANLIRTDVVETNYYICEKCIWQQAVKELGISAQIEHTVEHKAEGEVK